MQNMTFSPATAKVATMDELLSGYEKSMHVKTEEEIDAELSAKMVQEVNLVKAASSMQMDLAFKSEKSLEHNGQIDATVLEKAISVIAEIKEQKEKELATVKKTDPRHDTKVKEIEKRAAQTRFKAMKRVNARAEKV